MADLERMRSWYAEQGVPSVGDRVLDKVLRSISQLEDHPRMGRVVPEFGQDFLRELLRPPWRIVYRFDRRTVRVVRVWRSERPLRLPRRSSTGGA